MRTFASACVWLLIAGPLYAEIGVGYTAEWISHESYLIALGTPVDVENFRGSGDLYFTKARFRLDEVIKGPLTNGDSATVYDFSFKEADSLSLGNAKKESRQLLIFCRVAEHMYKEIDGKYIFCEVFAFKSAYYVNENVTKLFTPDFRLLTRFDELVERTRRQVSYEADLIRRYWKGRIEKKWLEVPFDSEAHGHLFAGSTCYLWVPGYEEEK